MNDFGREPKRLMKSIKSFLNTTRGIAAKRSRDKYGTAFWLYWRKDDVARALGIEWHMKWELTFSHRNVRAGLYFELNGKTRPILERIEEFMREEIATDMFTWRWKSDSNYVYIYRHRLMNEEALSVGSFEEVESATREKVGAFLDSDYRTIQGYFQCLAADPRRFSAGERST